MKGTGVNQTCYFTIGKGVPCSPFIMKIRQFLEKIPSIQHVTCRIKEILPAQYNELNSFKKKLSSYFPFFWTNQSLFESKIFNINTQTGDNKILRFIYLNISLFLCLLCFKITSSVYCPFYCYNFSFNYVTMLVIFCRTDEDIKYIEINFQT